MTGPSLESTRLGTYLVNLVTERVKYHTTNGRLCGCRDTKVQQKIGTHNKTAACEFALIRLGAVTSVVENLPTCNNCVAKANLWIGESCVGA